MSLVILETLGTWLHEYTHTVFIFLEILSDLTNWLKATVENPRGSVEKMSP